MPSEDVLFMLEGLGIRTGVDLDSLVLTGDWICQQLGRANSSKVAVARLASMKQKSDSEAALTAASSGEEDADKAKKRKAAQSNLEAAKVALCWPQLPTDVFAQPPSSSAAQASSHGHAAPTVAATQRH